MVMPMSWSQLFSVNAPAPTGLMSVFCFAALRAAGEAMKGQSSATCAAKLAFGESSLIVKVIGSTMVIFLFQEAMKACAGARVSGSAARSQLYLTASAS